MRVSRDALPFRLVLRLEKVSDWEWRVSICSGADFGSVEGEL